MELKINKRAYYKIGFALIILILILFSLFPLYWIFLTSLKAQRDLFAIPPKFTFKPTLEHWKSVVVQSEFFRYYKNSLVIAVSTVVIVMMVALLAAFGLERTKIRYKVKENLAFFILSQRMMPPVAVVIPIYLLFSSAQMLDRLYTLIIMNISFNLPLSIWMLRGYLESIPVDIEEAAIVDGCSHFGAFFRVGVPQIVPGLLSTALFAFIYTINEFFYALILSGTRARPVSVAVQLFLPTGVRGTMFGEAAVASILIMLPSLAFAVFMQRFLVSGISLGALKG